MNSPGLVFPRQCSQYTGIGADLCRNCKDVRDVFTESDRVLHQDVSRLCFDGPAEELDMTEDTQVKTRGRYRHPQSRSRRDPFQRNHEGVPDTTAPFSRQVERDHRKNGPDGFRHHDRTGTERCAVGSYKAC